VAKSVVFPVCNTESPKREVLEKGVVIMRRISFLLALLLFLVGSSMAGAATTGSISGNVTDSATSAAISGMTIKAYASPAGYFAAQATTDGLGNYILTGLDAGNYVVEAYTSGTNYLTQYWDHVSEYASASPVAVTAGVTTSSINFALQKGAGSISGKVTDGPSATALSGMTVSACPTAGGYCYTTTTSASGTYTITGVPAGSYVVSSGGTVNYVTQYYNNVYDVASATPVAVTAGGTTSNINFALQGSGSISGKVTDSATSAAISNMAVKVCPVAGGDCSVVLTDASGNYTAAAVVAGSYYVSSGGAGTNYYSQYYNNEPDQAHANQVNVTAGINTTNINFSLQKAGSITGKVTDSVTGAGLSGLTVNACPVAGGNCSSSYTDDSGNYSIPGLSAGNFYVNVDTYGTYYVEQYYNNASDPSSATPVSVSAGVVTSGINFALKIAPTKIGVFYNGYWYLDSNMSWAWDGTPTDTLGVFGVGLTGAIPVVGDWNGDGTTKIGVYMNGTWYLDMNRNWQWDGQPTDKMYSFGAGLPGAVPVVGDWNGDGTTKIGIYSNGVWYLDMNGNGQWDGEPTDKIAYFGVGLTNAVPVVGDWDGSGTTKIGIYQNGYWYLDVNGNGQWDGEPTDQLGVFGVGLTNAVPVVGDWNADGIDEIGIYQQGLWYLDKNRSWQWEGEPADQYGVFGVGLTGAVPVPGKW
jgi:major membrane immunogen (membrane-anchored lipoprotein)